MPAKPAATYEKDERIPPPARILAVAGELFYRHGIRAVGVDAIAEAASTNKMTLYRHFTSKDEYWWRNICGNLPCSPTGAGTSSRRRIPVTRPRSFAPGSTR